MSVAIAACAPPRSRRTTPTNEEGTPVGRIDYAKVKELNPRDDKGNTIFSRGPECFIRVPFDNPPTSWQPLKIKVVDCPPAMDDPAWDRCETGRILRAATGMCVCTRDGNPPPPPTEVPCPK